MQTFLARTAVSGLALWLTAVLVPGLRFGETDTVPVVNRVLTVVAVALVFGAVNTLVKPVLMFLSLPLVLVTLGLFTIVVNAAMIAFTSWLAGLMGLDFVVDRFWWDAVLAAVVVSIVTWVLERSARTD